MKHTWLRTLLRVNAILLWVISSLWMIYAPGVEPLFVFLVGMINFLPSLNTQGRPVSGFDISSLSPPQQQRNRQNMLRLVHNAWIEGVLKKSLHNEALKEADLEPRHQVEEHPWEMLLQTPGPEPQPLSPGTPMLEVFDRLGGSLLILGEAGSGKTTMLLELASQLIQRAENDPHQPIPVVFHLSSWTLKQSLAEWLVDELRGKYAIPNKVAWAWVHSNHLLLLLDGLDEVDPERAEACVEAIHVFRAEHPVQMAVCSRGMPYEEVARRLELKGALVLQPLSEAQVEAWLEMNGSPAESLREVLHQDAGLRELARSPLMLSMMLLVQREIPAGELQELETVEAQRKRLFEAYIAKMLTHPGASNPAYPAEQARKWLAFLAQKMAALGQTIFVIEDIRLKWLESPKQANRGRLWAATVALMAISGLVVGLPLGMLIGLMLGKGLGLGSGLLVGVLAGARSFGKLRPAEKVSLQWSNALLGLLAGLVSGVITGLIFGPIGGLAFGLSGGLVFGLKSTSDVSTQIESGQGLRNSTKYALPVGLGSGLIIGYAAGPLAGLGFGLGAWMLYGGGFLLSHYLLRWLLARAGDIPWDYTAFLDDAVERGLLRRVGGGYMFVHGMVRDYFAGEEVSPRIKANSE